MTEERKATITELIQREVVPALGCTEPIAVALAAAKASKLLGGIPDKVEMLLSDNIIKNAMGVGIPGTGMFGLPIAIALGAIAGKPEQDLEVLKDITQEDINIAKAYIDEHRITIETKNIEGEKLYVEAICKKGNDVSKVVIRHSHKNCCLIQLNDEIIKNSCDLEARPDSQQKVELRMNEVYDYAMNTPIEELEYIMKVYEMNSEAARLSMIDDKDFSKFADNDIAQMFFGNGIFSKLTKITASTSHARMSGAMFPVMSNSGSGNQGITVTLPIIIFARETNKSREELMRALVLGSLTAIHIKQYMSRLSALCGVVVASIGSGVGITYLLGGNYEQICYTIKNMIGNVTGMICDGAKTGCALKVATGVSVATLSSIMAMQNRVVTEYEGIIDADIDKTIQNLVTISTQGIDAADRVILNIMTSKGC